MSTYSLIFLTRSLISIFALLVYISSLSSLGSIGSGFGFGPGSVV